MGIFLKETLKGLCGINHWSYAVFWKTCCQNPQLLIWEECHYEPAGDKVHLLVNKMMTDNHVNIVGEGLVGRVAITGHHQWILSENYYREIHPPEVLKEICLQFAAGMQTIVVIPVPSHGVVQFGSYLTVAENMGFINDVKSLILELGCVPGVLQSENYGAKELPYESNVINASPFVADSLNYIGCSAQTPAFYSQTPSSVLEEFQNEVQSSVATFQASNSSSCNLKLHKYREETKTGEAMKLDFCFPNQFMNGVAKAEVIPNSVAQMNRHSSQWPIKDLPSSSSSGLNHGSDTKPMPAPSNQVNNLNLSKTETLFSDSGDCLTINPSLAYCSGTNDHKRFSQSEMNHGIPGFIEDNKKQKSGDDLFDVLGANFKDKWFSSCSESHSKSNMSSSEIFTSSHGKSDSEIFSFADTDHLLDAVVSKAHHSAKKNSDNDGSCMTTLNNMSSYSTSNALLPYGRFRVSMSSSSLRTGSSKEDSGSYSQDGSVYDPWIEKDQSMRQGNIVATGYSNKPHAMSKTSHKRVKPDQNPRPRPKDRQMIQDRVKELREIVPNGAKCSIDALLERTIKHMLFLQCVTKHADKLKQTAESKIMSKDGGLLLKDKYGGATWAYEIGSQSMVCPIIVEDLSQPHQMLVEMLCEERGSFLEIADIIRGLGLTILKGLMETQKGKIWARFVVEANKKVTRMEIFLSLVRLLDQNGTSSISQPNNNV